MTSTGSMMKLQLMISFPQSRSLRLTLIVLLLIGVALADYLTGSEIRVYPFYFVPIALAGICFGFRIALLTSILCTALWIVSNFLGGTAFSSVWIWVWNAAAQGTSFILIALLISRLKMAMEREQGLARIDNLTGLLNKRAFEERGPAIIALCKREFHPVALAYIDLDNFKMVNDTQGHQRGDEVLRIVAEIMKSSLRQNDLTARLGGDEFAVLLPNASIEAVTDTLERLRATIEAKMRSHKFDVTISIGAASYHRAPDSLQELVDAADRVMYVAKNSGKNRLHVAALPLPPV